MFQQLIRKIAEALDADSIAYMIIGGQAVMIYGEPRITRDIDITLGMGPDELHRLVRVAEKLGLTVIPPNPEEIAQKNLVLPCLDPTSGIRVDFIFTHSVYERAALERTTESDADGYQVRFASVEDLIIHKIIAGRPRDLEDVKTILLKQPNVDAAYIRAWIIQFDESLEVDYTERFESAWKLARR